METYKAVRNWPYNTDRWKALRSAQLARQPVCEDVPELAGPRGSPQKAPYTDAETNEGRAGGISAPNAVKYAVQELPQQSNRRQKAAIHVLPVAGTFRMRKCNMLQSQKLKLEMSKSRERLAALSVKDDATGAETAEMKELTDRYPALEERYRAAIISENVEDPRDACGNRT